MIDDWRGPVGPKAEPLIPLYKGRIRILSNGLKTLAEIEQVWNEAAHCFYSLLLPQLNDICRKWMLATWYCHGVFLINGRLSVQGPHSKPRCPRTIGDGATAADGEQCSISPAILANHQFRYRHSEDRAIVRVTQCTRETFGTNKLQWSRKSSTSITLTNWKVTPHSNISPKKTVKDRHCMETGPSAYRIGTNILPMIYTNPTFYSPHIFITSFSFYHSPIHWGILQWPINRTTYTSFKWENKLVHLGKTHIAIGRECKLQQDSNQVRTERTSVASQGSSSINCSTVSPLNHKKEKERIQKAQCICLCGSWTVTRYARNGAMWIVCSSGD